MAVNRQQFNLEEVDRIINKFTKETADKYSKEYFKLRLEILTSKWNDCQALHFDVKSTLKDSEKLGVYLQEYERVETLAFEHLEIFRLRLHEYVLKDNSIHLDEAAMNTTIPASSTSSASVNDDDSLIALERIKIPKFDGSYTNWASFSDIFNHIVHNNKRLGGVQKMHYLRTSVIGEAEQVIKHLNITDSNYESAWNLLCERYENKRVTANAFVKLLWELKPLSSQHPNALKTMLNTTNEVLNSFNNLGVVSTDVLLIHLLQQKLDSETALEWQKYIGGSTDIPTIQHFLEFLKKQTIIREATKASEKQVKYGVHTTHVHDFKKLSCNICSGEHKVQQCPKFLRIKETDRNELAKKLKLCFNCLSSKHISTACLSTFRCRICKGKHHTLLHIDHSKNKDNATASSSSSLKATTNEDENQTVVLLATATMWIRNNSGTFIPLRALLDQGSQRSFITESAAQQIGIKRQYSHVTINGIGNNQAFIKGRINVECKQRGTQETLHLSLLILSKITNDLPQLNVNPASIKNWKALADRNYNKPGRIDVLIGSDFYTDLILPGLRNISPGKLIIQNTRLGWVISGPTESKQMNNSNVTMISLQEINDNLKKFWEMEEVDTTPHLTLEQKSCDSHYAQTTVRDPDSGRYSVRLPFKIDICPSEALAPSMKGAISRWLQIERKLEQNPDLKTQYHDFLQEYLDLGHMEEVPVDEINIRSSYYLPHHAIIKESSTTTKLRVVFDASYRTSSGQSLNDILMVGPKVQNDLSSILLNWRLYNIVICGDIEKMYRQVLIDPRDRDYLRIVWRPKTPGPIKHYRLKTVTYGTACAAFQAVKTLNQLASDEPLNNDKAASTILTDFYVDDLLTGASDVKKAMELQKNITNLLSSGGFSIRKWTSNSMELLASIPEEERASPGPIEIDYENTIKTLGLQWNPQLDIFTFKVSLPNIEGGDITKRQVASSIAKLFDPLGWLQPVIIVGKILLQKLWLLELDWDQSLPDGISKEFKNYIAQCSDLEGVKIPRYVGTEKNYKIELHGFCDASSDAFAAVIYLRVVNCENRVRVNLLAAKTKVAPLKVQSIPRLELCGAVLLANLMQSVKKSLCLDSNTLTYYWTDSTIVLSWLQEHPNKWKTYIANRVSEIHSTSDATQWQHVETKWNPADCASRGLPALKLTDYALWWEGPTWLHIPKVNYSSGVEINPSVLEKKAIKSNLVTTSSNSCKRRKLDHSMAISNDLTILQRYSSYSKLTRVVAYCLRFKYHDLNSKFLTSEELQRAKLTCARLSQEIFFSEELKQLKKGKNIPATSRLVSLSPYIDSDGIIRVGGRLHNADASNSQKHPIILSPECKLAELVVRFFHLKTLHGSNNLTTVAIRQEYWIPQLQKMVKSCIHKCIVCFKTHATVQSQFMGSLPKERVTPSKPFSKVGLDFAGPITIKWSSGRGAKTIKSYIALFICLSTKAMHLEVVSDLTSKACIAAIKRFVSRRGLCTDIYSDCGTNFVGANKEFKAQFEQLKSSTQSHLANQQISWHFNPPSSPHFGGLWEAGVKSVKLHLTKTVGQALLNLEELYTVLTEIEAILNSRPLTPISNDINDEDALTPAHFLIGQSLLSIPQEAPDLDINLLKRWQLTTQMTHDFWKRWSREYLSRLQNRPKWLKSQSNLRDGQLVLVKDENYPPTKWPLARIIEVHPGADGLVRVATIKLNGRITKRAIVKLCPLPVEKSNNCISSKPTNQITPLNNSISTDQAAAINNNSTVDSSISEGAESRRSFRTRKQPINYASMLMFLLVTCCAPITKAVERSNSSVIQPVHNGFIIEHIGKAQLIRGALQLHVKLTWDEMNKDKLNINETLQNITRLCNTNPAFTYKVNCLHLIHQLRDMQQHIVDQMHMLQFIKGRQKRGLLGKMLTAILGVNDEVYHDIDTLQVNQQNLKSIVFNETKLFLRATHQLNLTNSRINQQMSRFSEKFNDALKELKIFITNIQEDNLRFMELYHRALNYLQAVQNKYDSIIKVIHRNNRVSDLLLPSELISIINRTESSLPLSLDVLHVPTEEVSIQFRDDGCHIFGYFRIIENEETPVPQFLQNRTFAIYDISPAILGVNFNNQHYFEISESELINSHLMFNLTYIVSINTLFDMRNKPNCLIKEFFKLYEGTNCTVRFFEISPNLDIMWKKLFSRNKWLFASSQIVPAHSVCEGFREEILLNKSGILSLKPGCKLVTNQHILTTEQQCTGEVYQIYATYKEAPLIITTSRPYLLSKTEVIKSSEDFSTLIDDAQQLYDDQSNIFWRSYHHHIGASILALSTSIILFIVFTITLLYFRCKKEIVTRDNTDTNTHIPCWYDLDSSPRSPAN